MDCKLHIVGQYQDTLVWKNSLGITRTEVRPFKLNQVQDSSLNLITGLLTNSSGMASPPVANLGAITFLALGSGQSTWDADPSNVVKPTTQTTLETETFRFSLSPNDFVFLNSSSGATLNPQALSSRFKVSYTLGTADANGDLREFGLFGGDATSTLDSGIMFNWITHPLIQKDNTLTIQRTIDIAFSINRS